MIFLPLAENRRAQPLLRRNPWKRVFGFTKVRYRGIWKNHQWLCAAFALVNLYQHRNRLAPQGA
jgi:IS5 family transposase